jgi:hypothetical protein
MDNIYLPQDIPQDIINNIFLFDGRFKIKKGKVSKFNQISKLDERRNILLKIPQKKFNNRENIWEVRLDINFSDKYNGFKYLKLQSTNDNNNNYKIELETFIDIGSKFAKIFLNNEIYFIC